MSSEGYRASDLGKGLRAIREMFAPVGSDDQPERVARAALGACHALFSASGAVLLLGGKPITKYFMTRDRYENAGEGGMGRTSLLEPRGLTVQAIEKSMALSFQLPAESEIYDPAADGVPGVSKPRQILAAPMASSTPAPGCLALVFEEPLAEAQETLQQLTGLAETIQLALEQQSSLQRLRKLSTTDDLTGAYNYRYLLDGLRREIQRASRFKQVFSFMMLDVDHLKEYNDLHGHLAGSRLLASFSQIVQSHLRAVDTLAKYGGDEFGVILPQTGKEGARVVADRIRAAIEAHPFPGETRKITTSLGVASFPEDGDDVEGLLGKADEALYRAKDAGRNRVCLVGEP
jgi:diguanylate cyclase (GGDEF)-like protein